MNAARIEFTEEILVTLLKKRERTALNHLYDNYANVLLGIILKSGVKVEVAEDILQEVFIKIWKNIDSYDSQRGRLYTWMLNIARNAAIDYTRSKNSQKDFKNQSLDNSVNDINKVENLEQKTDNIGIKQLVERLPGSQREIIDMVYFKGYTQQETSEELNIPLGTVKTRVRSAIGALRSLFSD